MIINDFFYLPFETTQGDEDSCTLFSGEMR